MKTLLTISLACLISLVLLSYASRAQAQASTQDHQLPSVIFLPETDTTLKALAAGEPGVGWLIYYLEERGVEEPSLVVRLSNKSTNAHISEAFVYDAWPGQTHVPIEIERNRFRLPSTLQPVLHLRAIGGWWMRNGVVNYNLEIETRGSIISMWGAETDPRFSEEGWRHLIQKDEPATHIIVRDRERDGIPDWDLRTLLPIFPGRGYHRTNYAERKCRMDLEVDPGISPLWPYVAAQRGYEQEPGKLRPPIVVDWDQGRITHFSELVSVRNQNCSYSLYSIEKVVSDKLNHANFETPFAFYDLSGEGKGMPNLILRAERFPQGDPWSVGMDPKGQAGRPAPRDFESIRYSWRNQVGDNLWDYKIDVLGFHPYTFETPIADGRFTIDAPPFEQFPQWILERSWPVVTFVDTEGNSYRSSEGIYEWSARNVGIGYVFGWQEEKVNTAFSSIREGFRGEYRYRQNREPRLYFSPIDNRLHLLSAEGGLWNLGAGKSLRLHNLNGDLYIDGWTRELLPENTDGSAELQVGSAPLPEEALYALGGHLIYSSAHTVIVCRSVYTPATFEILPPIDQATWRSFQQQVDPYTSHKRDPQALQSWLDAFPGTTFAVTDAHISGMQAIPGGYRFVLHLQPGFEVQQPGFVDIEGLAPGDYVVTFDGRWTVAEATAPVLSLEIESPFDESRDVAPEPVVLWVVARNQGVADSEDLQLVLRAESKDERVDIYNRGIRVPSGDLVPVTVQWQPPQGSAEWILTAHLENRRGEVVAITSSLVQESALHAVSSSVITWLSSNRGQRLPALASLLAFVLLMSVTVAFGWSRREKASP